MKQIIGVAGYMGSGKSTLVHQWSTILGYPVLDADCIAKELMNTNREIIQSVNKHFGTIKNDAIDFAKLGPIVFADSKKLNLLNSIVHPRLIYELNTQISNSSTSLFVDCALLSLWNGSVKTDFSIWVETDFDTRLHRLVNRTGLSDNQCRERIQKQESLFQRPDIDLKEWFCVENQDSLQVAIEFGLGVINTARGCVLG